MTGLNVYSLHKFNKEQKCSTISKCAAEKIVLWWLQLMVYLPMKQVNTLTRKGSVMLIWFLMLKLHVTAVCHARVLQNSLEQPVIDGIPAKTLTRTWENNPSIWNSHTHSKGDTRPTTGVTGSFLSLHITWYHMVSTVSSHCRLHSSLLRERAHQIFLISLLPVSSPWCCYNHCAVCLSYTFPHYTLKPIFRHSVK